MATNTVTPVRNSTGSATHVTNTAPTLFFHEKSRHGSTTLNAAKESLSLLHLLQEVKIVGTVLGEFKCNHGESVSDAGIKHL